MAYSVHYAVALISVLKLWVKTGRGVAAACPEKWGKAQGEGGKLTARWSCLAPWHTDLSAATELQGGAAPTRLWTHVAPGQATQRGLLWPCAHSPGLLPHL